MEEKFTIKFFGVMGDTWTNGMTFTNRQEARKYAKYYNFEKKDKVSNINRGVYKYAMVVKK